MPENWHIWVNKGLTYLVTYLLNYLNLRLIGKQRELADWEYDGRERQLSTNMFPGFYLLLCESIFV